MMPEEWSTRKVKAQALKMEMELAIKKREQIFMERVEFVWSDAVLRCVSRIRALPFKAAAICSCKSKAEAQEIIGRMMTEAMEELTHLAEY